jgi:hypothetical protein
MQLQSTMASLPLIYDYTAVFEAIDPATGNAITGVVVIDPSIYGVDLTGGDNGGAVPAVLPAQFVPVDVTP